MNFCHNVLGFIPIRRPGSFDFDRAWLFGYGIGIQLLQAEDLENIPRKKEIIPKDNHVSFHCDTMGAIEKKLISCFSYKSGSTMFLYKPYMTTTLK